MTWGIQFRGRVDALVHDAARGDEVIEARHRAFIVSHLCGGFVAVLAVPIYLYVVGMPGVFEALALLWLISPLALALFLSRSGRLAVAHLMSAMSLALLVGCVASVTGGLSSFILVWLAVVPVEAALSGSRRIVAAAVALSAAVLLALGISGLVALLPAPLVFANPATLGVIGVGSALVYVGGLALSIQDIHEKSMNVLRRSEARYRLMADNATDLITCHDEDGAVTFVSGALKPVLGENCGDVLGQRLVDQVHVADRIGYLQALSTAIETDEPATVEFRVARGQIAEISDLSDFRWVEMRCRRLPELAMPGRTDRIVAITRNITDRKRQQFQLVRSRDEAEEANRAKTQFLAKVSHELRTPLNAIIGFSEILKSELDAVEGNDQRVEYTDLINESGNHLLNVVNDLMNMSRLEAGKFEICPSEFDLNEVVSSSVGIMRPSAEQAGVEIVVDFASEELEVNADPRALRQIVLNLLSNAIKFTPSGGRAVVSTGTHAGMVEVSVTDDGIGIPSDVLPKITNPFVQADNGLDRHHEGTGLGLSVVKGLTELHGGTISIESRVGDGTRVAITLPQTGALDIDVPSTASGPEQGQTCLLRDVS